MDPYSISTLSLKLNIEYFGLEFENSDDECNAEVYGLDLTFNSTEKDSELGVLCREVQIEHRFEKILTSRENFKLMSS